MFASATSQAPSSVCLQLGSKPNGLVSLLEMVKRYGQELYKIAQFVAYISNAVDERLDKPQTREHLAAAVGGIHATAMALGLEQSSLFVKELVRALEETSSLGDVFTKDTIRCMELVFRNELGSVYFKHLDRQQASLYLAKEPFGEKVGAKFFESTDDIEEATKCLALERPTACVFHLMRHMERTVQHFGKTLGVEETIRFQSWHDILKIVTSKIEGLSGERAQHLNEAQALLHHVRRAWRNPIMHPKESYNQEQAVEIYEAVKSFTVHLAEVL